MLIKYNLPEVVVGMVISPKETMRNIGDASHLRIIFITYLLVQIVVGLGVVLFEPSAAMLSSGFVLVIIMLFFMSPILLFLQASLCFGIARLFGARGKLLDIFAMLMLANIPLFFVVPLELFSFLPNIIGTILRSFGLMLLSIWILQLTIHGICEVFKITIGRAVFFHIVPSLFSVFMSIFVFAS